MKITRRQAGALVAGTALAQTPAPPAPEDELKAAREQVRRNAEALAKFELAMATEPACVFKA